MKYTLKIQKAIRFATKVHEIDQKQKRKGKDIAYITHPLTVALILSQAQAKEDVIVAGLLHDTIEDCSTDSPVTKKDIEKDFGKKVVSLVDSVTEKNSNLSWAERKRIVRKYIKNFSNEMILLKSADVLANGTEIIADYRKESDLIFKRFNAPKQKNSLVKSN